jgi:hypothetical protein
MKNLSERWRTDQSADLLLTTDERSRNENPSGVTLFINTLPMLSTTTTTTPEKECESTGKDDKMTPPTHHGVQVLLQIRK